MTRDDAQAPSAPAAAIAIGTRGHLHRVRSDAGFVHRVVGAVVRDDRFGEQAGEERDELLEPRDELARRQRLVAEHGGVEADAARADAEDEAPARDVIERDHVLRERDRVAQVRRRDHRAEPDAFGRGGDARSATGWRRTTAARGSAATTDGRRSRGGRSRAPRAVGARKTVSGHGSVGSINTPKRTTWSLPADGADEFPMAPGSDSVGRTAGILDAQIEPEVAMSGVRVLVGTRKGAFILTADGKRKDWKVDGPLLRRVGDVPRQGRRRLTRTGCTRRSRRAGSVS